MERFRLPRYSRLTVSSLIGVFLIVMGVIMVTRREKLDPFSSFTNLFGEDAEDAALARGFKCVDAELIEHLHSISDYCSLRDTDEMFSGIYMRMSGNFASEISFWLRENTLTIGDLVLLWGQPDIQYACDTVTIAWPDRHIIGFVARPRNGLITYFQRVISVSFTRSGLPYWQNLALVNSSPDDCGSTGVDLPRRLDFSSVS